MDECQVIAEKEDEQKRCRVCFESNNLVQEEICNCKGSQNGICRECLERELRIDWKYDSKSNRHIHRLCNGGNLRTGLESDLVLFFIYFTATSYFMCMFIIFNEILMTIIVAYNVDPVILSILQIAFIFISRERGFAVALQMLVLFPSNPMAWIPLELHFCRIIVHHLASMITDTPKPDMYTYIQTTCSIFAPLYASNYIYGPISYINYSGFLCGISCFIGMFIYFKNEMFNHMIIDVKTKQN